MLFTSLHPFFILPRIVVLPNYRSCFWRMFAPTCIRICFFCNSICTFYFVFIGISFSCKRNKTLPNTTRIPSYIKWMFLVIPIIKISNYRNFFCIRRPNCKISTFYTVFCDDMRTKFFIQFIMFTALK